MEQKLSCKRNKWGSKEVGSKNGIIFSFFHFLVLDLNLKVITILLEFIIKLKSNDKKTAFHFLFIYDLDISDIN